MKTTFNLLFASIILIFASPIIIAFMALVFLSDFSNPLYVSYRVGKNNKKFKIYKLRSMCLGADKKGNSFSAKSDNRVTKIGKIIRKFKIDELTQFINVILLNMSIVGPRPNIEKEIEKYSEQEKKLLSIKPGITDFSSIIFSNENSILEKVPENDIINYYYGKILPWKNKFGFFYIEKSSFKLDLKLILYTAISIVNKKLALKLVYRELVKLNAPQNLLDYLVKNKKCSC